MKMNTQRRRLLAAAGTAALASLSGCSGLTPVVGKRAEERRTFAADAVDAVAVDGRNGDVTVRPADGDRVRVETVKKAGSVFADLDDVRVDVVTEDGQLRVEVRKNGDGSLLAGIPSVDVTVGLPSGVGLDELRCENGDVDVQDVAGDATLATENGDVDVRNVDGFVSVDTENGDVTVRTVTGINDITAENGDVGVDVPAIRGDTVLETENGDVSAAVSPDVNAAVVATTDTGEIAFDVSGFEASTRDEERVEGTLGDGGPQLRFETENGDVEVSELG